MPGSVRPWPTDSIPAAVFDDPRLRAFLPMFYLARADVDLTSQEVDALWERFTGRGEVESGLRDEFSRWLDPGAPPLADELHQLLGRSAWGGSGALPGLEGRLGGRGTGDLGGIEWTADRVPR